MITLYSSDGTIKKSEIKKFNYNGEFKGACFITATISSDSPINFEIGDYCIFRGERFTLNYDAAKKKQASRGSHGEAFIYENIKFNSLSDELTTIEFIDVVPSDNNIHFTSKPTFEFYASSPQDLADKIQANLDLEFTGEKKWKITIDQNAKIVDKLVSISAGTTLWDAVALFDRLFGLNFIIRGREIKVGTAGLDVGRVFSYGKGNGLYDIEQHTNVDAKIITRLRAYGSTRNMPRRYYNDLKKPDGTPYIEESADISNLMLPSFPYEESDPRKVYLESKNVSKYGVRYGSVFFDQSEGELKEIYPSIEGMTKQQLSDAGMSVSLPTADNGNLDEVLGADNPTDNGLIPDEPESIPQQFKIYLKDMGFDLTEKDENGQYKYATTDTMQISMRSGMCIGRTFDIVEDGITKDTSLGYTRYIIECNRFEDDSIAGGTAFPNDNFRVRAGDKFVILGIEMPDVYIKAAAQRLKVASEEYLSSNDETKYTYTPKIDDILMAKNPDLAESIREGSILSFSDDDLQIDASEIIQTLTINYDLEKSDIPSYDLVLNNERIAGTIEKMQNSINTLMSNKTGITIDQVKSLISSIGGSLFLSKRFNDIANGLITFTKGLDIGEYTSGLFGGGGTFRMNNGDSEIEVDRLTVRKLARFFEVLIERASHIGGSYIISPARMICSKVEELESVYRCYFETGDNGEFVQEFIVGDQARCQVFLGSTQKYYWRLVDSIGDNYIDLSKSDADKDSSIPEVGDYIFQLGNRTNKNRQNAQILSSFGDDSPSFKQYEGIDSFSLEGKERTVISPNNNVFDGKLVVESGSTGWENFVGLPEEFQSLAAGAVNLIRNSGFVGDYKSKRLDRFTRLEPDTDMFSDKLTHWDGLVNINSDEESASGYSAILLDQTLSQPIPTVFTENYVLSFKAKGEFIKYDVSGESGTIQLKNEYDRYVVELKSGDTKLFSISGRCTICDIQLERGTIPSDYSPSPLDNDKTLAQFEAIRFITDAIKNGNTTILGGLVLSSMIQVGNYVNGRMDKVTAGLNGTYNQDNDVAFWAGGNFEKAMMNAYDPFTTDTDKMINFVVTHGGQIIANEAIIRGHIIAKSGEIGGIGIDEKGIYSLAKGEDGSPMFKLNGEDGSGYFAGGGISWDSLANLLIRGRFESNKDGNKIVIDSDSRTFKMYSKDGYEVFSLSFSEGLSWDNKPYILPILTVNRYLDNKLSSYVKIDGKSIGVYPASGASFFVADVINQKIWIDASKLPQGRDNANPREVYMDGENLKVYRF